MPRKQVAHLIAILQDFHAQVTTLIQKNAGMMTLQEVYEMQSAIDPLLDSLIDVSIPNDLDFRVSRPDHFRFQVANRSPPA